jgi:peptidyl-tRNA hydrolase
MEDNSGSPSLFSGLRIRQIFSILSMSTAASAALAAPTLLQYIVLRSDLGWPLGSLVAQACHASVAAVWLSRDAPGTVAYCAPAQLDSMHKVVLNIQGEEALRALSDELRTAGVVHKLWVEQPENIITCLATAPGDKAALASHFKKLKLAK